MPPGDAADNYLVEGITDDLTGDLSHIPGAFVLARASAYSYRGKAIDVRKIGRELGVRYAVQGSVRQIGPMLRVNGVHPLEPRDLGARARDRTRCLRHARLLGVP